MPKIQYHLVLNQSRKGMRKVMHPNPTLIELIRDDHMIHFNEITHRSFVANTPFPNTAITTYPYIN